MARILVIDDEALPARLVARLLVAHGHDAQPVSWFDDLHDRLAENWDLAVVDLVYNNSDESGLDAMRLLSNSASQPSLVLLCSVDQTRKHLIETAFERYELRGAVPKDAPEDILLRCIDDVLAGGTYIDHVMASFRSLTPASVLKNATHAAILCAIAEGHHSHGAIADAVNISSKTSENAVRSIGDALFNAGLITVDQPKFSDILAWASANAPFLLRWRLHEGAEEASTSSPGRRNRAKRR